MKLDLSKFLALLSALPHCPRKIPNPASRYALTHILQPLQEDERISFPELDFAAFTFGDLDRICDALSLEEESCNRALRLFTVLHATEPKAAAKRCFC